MTMPEEAKLIIAEAAAEFPAIVGAPTEDDLKRIREFLANLLQSIDIPGGRDNLSGLINVSRRGSSHTSHPSPPMPCKLFE